MSTSRNLLLLLILIAMFIMPALADVDQFTINTLYSSPTDYQIDYGINTTAYLWNYSIESSTNLAANQTWLLLASNNQSTIATLDTQTNISFVTTVPQNFSIATPDYYRYYYLVFENGFYDSSTVLTLTLYSNTHTIGLPAGAAAPTSIPMLPAVHKEPPPYQWVSDNIVWVVIALLVIVGLIVIRRRG